VDYANLFARIETLELSQANFSIASAELMAAEMNVGRIVRTVDWLNSVSARWRRKRAAAALKSDCLLIA